METATKELSVNKAQTFEKLDHYYLDKMREEGVEVIEWTPAEIARGLEYSMSIWEGFAVDELSRKVLDSQIAYLKLIGVIQQ
jgi:TRAP-type C4-dicarboxylate transport system substrate-binding protein